MTWHFLSASSTESLAALLFNGFVTLFLLPILLMDLCFYFPSALVHLALGKARPRILSAALSGLPLWVCCIGVALCATYLIQPRAFALLFHTYGGLAGLALGTLNTLVAFVRYRRNMRAFYFSQVLEKNLSPRQAKRYEKLKDDFRSGKLDAEQWIEAHGRDMIGCRIAREYLDGLEGRITARHAKQATSSVYFL